MKELRTRALIMHSSDVILTKKGDYILQIVAGKHIVFLFLSLYLVHLRDVIQLKGNTQFALETKIESSQAKTSQKVQYYIFRNDEHFITTIPVPCR